MSNANIHDLKGLLLAGDRLSREADTWADGFARKFTSGLVWDKESDFAQVRYIQLRASAAFLRQLHRKLSPVPQPVKPAAE